MYVMCALHAILSNYIFDISDCVRGIMNEGMPMYQNPEVKGNLYVKFNIIFPPNNFIDPEKLKVSIIQFICSSVFSLIHPFICLYAH